MLCYEAMPNFCDNFVNSELLTDLIHLKNTFYEFGTVLK